MSPEPEPIAQDVRPVIKAPNPPNVGEIPADSSRAILEKDGFATQKPNGNVVDSVISRFYGPKGDLLLKDLAILLSVGVCGYCFVQDNAAGHLSTVPGVRQFVLKCIALVAVVVGIMWCYRAGCHCLQVLNRTGWMRVLANYVGVVIFGIGLVCLFYFGRTTTPAVNPPNETSKKDSIGSPAPASANIGKSGAKKATPKKNAGIGKSTSLRK